MIGCDARFLLALGTNNQVVETWSQQNAGSRYVYRWIEAKLHPNKQAEIVDHMIQTMPPCLILTNSDVVTMRFLRRVADKTLNNQDLVLVFLSDDGQYEQITKMEKGYPSPGFPPNFFELSLSDSREILRARRL